MAKARRKERRGHKFSTAYFHHTNVYTTLKHAFIYGNIKQKVITTALQ